MTNFTYPQIGKVNSDRVLHSILHQLEKHGYHGGELDPLLLERCLPVHYSLFKSVIDVAREYKVYVLNLQENFGYDLFSYPSASAAQGVANAIQLAMLDDENQYINYYVHELNFGEDWKPGMIVDSEGKDFALDCDGALWCLLIDNIRHIIQNRNID